MPQGNYTGLNYTFSDRLRNLYRSALAHKPPMSDIALGDIAPVAGEATALMDAEKALSEGNYGMAGLSALGAIPAFGGIFAGKKAIGANLKALAMAEEMRAAKAPRREIWDKTGWFFDEADGNWKYEIPDTDLNLYPMVEQYGLGDDISIKEAASWQGPELMDVNRAFRTEGPPPLNEIQPYPQVLQDYPDIGEVGLLRAELPPGTRGAVGVSGDVYLNEASPLREGRHVAAHELQHKVQRDEGFATGGSLSTARQNIMDEAWEQIQPLEKDYFEYNRAAADRRGWAGADIYNSLDKIAKGEGSLRPSRITNSSLWYEISDQIRREIGPQPKRAGPERDKWVMDAAGMLRDHYLKSDPGWADKYVELAGQGDKAIRNAIRRADRRLDKVRVPARQFEEGRRYVNEVNKLPLGEAYIRLAGEAEARNVQRRYQYIQRMRESGMSDERIKKWLKKNPPWETLAQDKQIEGKSLFPIYGKGLMTK